MNTTQPTSIAIFQMYTPSSSDGIASNNGIVFSSMNSYNTMHPVAIVQNDHPHQSNAPIQSTNSNINGNNNYNLEFGSNYSPFAIQLQPNADKPSFVSSGLIFAPLMAAPSLPTSQPSINSTSSQLDIFTESQASLGPKPISFANPSQTHYVAPVNSFLKPSVQCGISNYTHSRVVGGTITQIGMTYLLC